MAEIDEYATIDPPIPKNPYMTLDFELQSPPVPLSLQRPNDIVTHAPTTLHPPRCACRNLKMIILIAVSFAIIFGLSVALVYTQTKGGKNKEASEVTERATTSRTTTQIATTQTVVTDRPTTDVTTDQQPTLNAAQATTSGKETITTDSASNHVLEMSTSAPIEGTTKHSIPEGLCQVKYMNRCFWLDVHYAFDVNFTQAEEICRSNASEPAFIPDVTTYNLLVNHIRANIPSGRWHVDIWTGTRYDPTSGTVTAKNGTNPYLKWYPGTPYAISHFTHVYLVVRLDPGNPYRGMLNVPPSNDINGVICEAGNQDGRH